MNQNIEQFIDQLKRERQEQLIEAKAALFGYLAERHPQIAHITVSYDGYGDEGSINESHCYDGLDPTSHEIEVKDEHLDDLLDTLLDHATPAGYEINEGGDGELHIYPATRKVIVHHWNNVITQEHAAYEA